MDQYRPKIERAIAYILDHIAEPLTLEEVARVAHTSEFHFHRIFASVVGEPVGRFITRKRMEIAALRLAYEPDRPVTEIALDVGYSSHSNFSKAFAAFFGCAPSAIRDPDAPEAIGKLTKLYDKRFRPRDLWLPEPRAPQTFAADVRFETSPGFSVACLAAPGGYDPQLIERVWSELIDKARALGLAGDAVDAWGMAFDSPNLTAPELLRYHACVPCPDDVVLPEPLFRSRVPAGRYAVFTHAGPVGEIEDHYLGIYSSWFPSSGHVPDDYVVLAHYIDDFPKDGHIRLESWFKLAT